MFSITMNAVLGRIQQWEQLVRPREQLARRKDAPWKRSYQPVVANLLRELSPRNVLDVPSGEGWLRPELDDCCVLDGIDLYAERPAGYRSFTRHNLDDGLPESLGRYEAIVSCEGIEHFGNPELFLRTARRHLVPGGMLVVSTPNTWHPAARLQYLLRGFFPSFPCLVGRVQSGDHMHIMPWSFPQLYLYLHLAGFRNIRLHGMPERKPKHLFEWLFGLPQALYCRHKYRRATSPVQRAFWRQAGSRQSVFGRRLLVTATA
ncbi:hypothetical protein GCM10025770_11390 [Viridibacterium curvum]|uniref:Class I SAM-dependent methyltransferase n=1 Tax=Viridibacterium curvum TaxID=1101404 RepID=A0ABP9QH30_9RHOO